jgi:hypothetical protein
MSAKWRVTVRGEFRRYRLPERRHRFKLPLISHKAAANRMELCKVCISLGTAPMGDDDDEVHLHVEATRSNQGVRWLLPLLSVRRTWHLQSLEDKERGLSRGASS